MFYYLILIRVIPDCTAKCIDERCDLKLLIRREMIALQSFFNMPIKSIDHITLFEDDLMF